MMRNPQRYGHLRPYAALGMLAAASIALASCDTDSLLEGEPSAPGQGPTVTVQTNELPQRAGLTDSLHVTVTAQASPTVSGLARVGIAVRQGQTVIVRGTDVAGQSVATRTLAFHVGELTPDAQGIISFQVFGWAIDQAGQCTLVGANNVAVSCSVQGGLPIIPGLQGIAANVQVITARSLKVAPSISQIGDLVVDVARRVVYISNKSTNSVEVVNWASAALERTASIRVGSLPWGMTIDHSGDTLIVANSGGTSLSYVSLNARAESRRYETPNAVLYQLTGETDTTFVTRGEDVDTIITVVDSGVIRLDHIDFSDRPQHVAQDQHGVVLYSTQPTVAAPDGSVRWVEWDRVWNNRESNLLLWTQVVKNNQWGRGVPPDECWDENQFNRVVKGCVIAFVDSVKVYFESPVLGTELIVFDHVPGTTQVIADTSASLFQLKTNMQARGSDIFMYVGMWDMPFWLTGDTTFVRSSGNGASISIAEGARSPSRVWMWNAISPHPPLTNRLISNFVNIADYANNTSDRTTGVSVNFDGFVHATRSQSAAYFFSNPLRLNGTFADTAIAGGRGVGLHPSAQFTGGDPNTNWAAVGGSGAEIVIVDTRHFRRIGTIPIGERSAGPLKVIGPVATDPGDVVGHVFGVTPTGAVFEVAVRTSDISP